MLSHSLHASHIPDTNLALTHTTLLNADGRQFFLKPNLIYKRQKAAKPT